MARKKTNAAARLLASLPSSQSASAQTKEHGPVSAPLTFDLPLALIEKIEVHRKRLKLGSASAVVRLAILDFDFGTYRADAAPHRQLSVRLPPKLRKFLVQTARKKKASLGELLRAALDDLS
jgi:hypothetical protein